MDSKIKILIAEDDLDTQEIIASFINPLKAFEIIGSVHDGESLVEMMVDLGPDLIIADINMPNINGIDAIRQCIQIRPSIKFIFLTGHKEYATTAFDLNAVDYLLKPLKKDRLYVGLEKAKCFLHKKKMTEKDRKILTVKVARASFFIHFSSILFIEKENRKTVIHTLDEKYETNETLESIYKRLNLDFFRTHRSFIVNIHWISHITGEGETYFAHLRKYPQYVHVSKLRLNELYKELSTHIETTK
ncbi:MULTISPECIES: LytR/AlgR family response regulator transcription factor [Bacillaceae]|uniref:LytTR family DNA-binding domain-containing protein n=1 Tax=Evansella alkalicola TaxID=745819 RepID=A0ABS6JY20_9BACI|nr:MULTISPECIES: LytTR family DNA-binding domain-containing protein [Bacillaceae]MBU9722986.1 LytTR family DNA-binding domain-containing protein [Bacillus alkalicola]